MNIEQYTEEEDDDLEPGYMTQLLKNPMHTKEVEGGGGERPTLGNKDDFVRRSTFSRTMTFSPEAYHRNVTAPLEGLQRTFTEIGNRIDPDAQYTNALMETYVKAGEGGEGDLPLQTGFARKKKFWKVMLLVTIIAGFMGLVAAGFMNATQKVRYAAFEFGNFFSSLFKFYFVG